MHMSIIMICGGCHEHIGGAQSTEEYPKCTGGVQCIGEIPTAHREDISIVMINPNALMISPQCTEHSHALHTRYTLYRVKTAFSEVDVKT